MITSINLGQPHALADFDSAKMRKEMDQNYHIYQWCRRVWAQKPFDEPSKVKQPDENVEPTAA